MNATSQLINQLEEKVILVDQSDRQIGVAEKLQAHYEGWLHRAFSIFVINKQGQLLYQKMADCHILYKKLLDLGYNIRGDFP